MSETTTAKRVRDTEQDMIPGIRRQVKALETRGHDEDPWVAVELMKIAAEAEAAAVRLIAHYRAEGYRWADIATSFGMTPQACCKKYEPKIRALAAA